MQKFLLASNLNLPGCNFWPRCTICHYSEESGFVVFVAVLQAAVSCNLVPSWTPLGKTKQAQSPQPLLKGYVFQPLDLSTISQILEGISAIPKHFTDVTLRPQR